LPGAYRQRVRRLIASLANDPHPPRSKELRDLPGYYRVPLDEWRIIYYIENDEVVVIILTVRLKTGEETYHDISDIVF
jgi:mRNA interferase RelE/StbE